MFQFTTSSAHFAIFLPAAAKQFGTFYFYFGCRERATQPFRNELDSMMQHKVINKVSVAYSRESGKTKVVIKSVPFTYKTCCKLKS